MANFVKISGRAGRDAEAKTDTVVKFSVAVSEVVVTNGEPWTRTSWIDCVAFGETAQAAKKVKQGSSVTIEGKLHQNRWEKDGVKRSRIEVVVEKLEII